MLVLYGLRCVVCFSFFFFFVWAGHFGVLCVEYWYFDFGAGLVSVFVMWCCWFVLFVVGCVGGWVMFFFFVFLLCVVLFFWFFLFFFVWWF